MTTTPQDTNTDDIMDQYYLCRKSRENENYDDAWYHLQLAYAIDASKLKIIFEALKMEETSIAFFVDKLEEGTSACNYIINKTKNAENIKLAKTNIKFYKKE